LICLPYPEGTISLAALRSLALLGHILRYCAICLAGPPPSQCGSIISNESLAINEFAAFFATDFKGL
jgi:hypothetical protein